MVKDMYRYLLQAASITITKYEYRIPDCNEAWSNMAKTNEDSMLFPQKLMEILTDPENQKAISWLPSGTAFVIHDRDMFAESVMPKNTFHVKMSWTIRREHSKMPVAFYADIDSL